MKHFHLVFLIFLLYGCTGSVSSTYEQNTEGNVLIKGSFESPINRSFLRGFADIGDTSHSHRPRW